MSHIERKREKITENVWYPVQYAWNKFVKLFPYTALSIVSIWILRVMEWDLSLREIIKYLLRLPLELMMLAGSGMVSGLFAISDGIYVSRIMNHHLWYICSMLFVLPIVVFLLTYAKKAKALVLTVLPMFLYGILIMKDGTVDGWHDAGFAFFFCNLRALAGLLLGAAAYYLSQWWKQREYTILGKLTLTLIEVLSFAVVAFLSSFINLRYDALFIGLLFLSISLSNAGVTYTVKIGGKLFDFLGAISLPIYCLQMPVIIAGPLLLHTSNPRDLFVITLVLSVVNEVVFRIAGKLTKVCNISLKGLFIK